MLKTFLEDVIIFGSPYGDSARQHLKFCCDNSPRNGLNLEFGVYNGRTINWIADYKDRVYGFDSFQGLPENYAYGKRILSKGYFKCAVPKVKPNVSLIRGWFNQTLSKFLQKHQENISFLHIDCDLYSSCQYVLELLNNQIQPGTVICFDELCDWRLELKLPSEQRESPKKIFSNWREHEWKALVEWMEKYDRQVEPLARTYAVQGSVKVLQ